MSGADNRREHDRIEVPTFRVTVADQESFHSGYLQDLSKGGLFVWTQSVRPIDDVVEVAFQPPGWEEFLFFRGRVAHVKTEVVEGVTTPVGMGVRFVGVDQKTYESLAKLLTEHEAPALTGDDAVGPEASEEEVARATEVLEERLQDVDEQIEDLQAEITGYSEDEQASRRIVEQLRAEIDGIRAEDAGAEREQNISSLRAECERLVQELEQQQSAAGVLTDLTGKVERARETAAAHASRLAKLTEQDSADLGKARDSSQELRELLARDREQGTLSDEGWRLELQAESQLLDRAEENLATIANRTEDDTEGRERQLETLRERCTAVRKDCQKARERAAKLQRREERLTTKLKRQRASCNELGRLISTLSQEAKAIGVPADDLDFDLQEIEALLASDRAEGEEDDRAEREAGELPAAEDVAVDIEVDDGGAGETAPADIASEDVAVDIDVVEEGGEGAEETASVEVTVEDDADEAGAEKESKLDSIVIDEAYMAEDAAEPPAAAASAEPPPSAGSTVSVVLATAFLLVAVLFVLYQFGFLNFF